MRRIALPCMLALLATLTLAQTGSQSKPKIESCGFGGSVHNCHCLERTDAIHRKIIDYCERTSKGTKDRDACLKSEMISHCDMAERITKWDEDSHYEEGGDSGSEMGPLCSMVCKKHRCRCADGPTCNFGMTDEEIREVDKKR